MYMATVGAVSVVVWLVLRARTLTDGSGAETAGRFTLQQVEELNREIVFDVESAKIRTNSEQIVPKKSVNTFPSVIS